MKFTIEQINSFIPDKRVVGAGSWGTVYEGFIGSSDLNGERVAVKVGNYFCEEKEFSTDENYIQWKVILNSTVFVYVLLSLYKLISLIFFLD